MNAERRNVELDHAKLKQRMRAMWCEGDWPAIAARLDGAARALVEQCGVRRGDRVLDVAAGNGNVAVWAARAGAHVVASDLSPVLVEQGRRRCAAEGIAVEWREADMEDLPFADAMFHSVLCAFGITFAARPDVALAEMLRVVRPGGCIAFANWTRDGWAARLSAVMNRHLRPTVTTDGPAADDKAATLASWLLEHAATVRMDRGVLRQHFASPEAWWEHWDASAPQMAMARQVLSAAQYGELRADLIASASVADPGDDTGCSLTSEYILMLATKRAPGNWLTGVEAYEAASPA